MVLTKETSLFQQDAIQNGVTDAGSKATSYIGDVSGSSGTGMDLHPVNNGANNYIRLDTDGMKVYKGGILIASYGDSIILSRLVNSNPIKALEINSSGLYLYGSSASTADVELTSTGLKLIKGGIQAGAPNASGFVYLSSDPYGSYTINGSTGISDWKAIIGTKFGVTADGTLYANGANITGNLTITGHTNTVASELSDAATKATNFLTNLDNVDGLVIRKDATSNNDYVNIQSNAIRIVTGGAEAFKTWVENNATTVRIGIPLAWHMLLENDKVVFMRNTTTEAGRINFNNNHGTMFVGGAATSQSGLFQQSGLYAHYSQSSLIYENDQNSESEVLVMEGSIHLTMVDRDCLYDDPPAGPTIHPEGSIYIASQNEVDGIAIALNSVKYIYMRSINTYFALPNNYRYTSSRNDPHTYIYMQYLPPGSTGSYLILHENGYITSGGSSSKRYKHNIEAISKELDPHKLYDIDVIQFIYNDNYLSQKDQRFRKKVPGFIAEDVYEHYPIAVDLKNGRPEDWNHRFILPPMLKLIQEQHDEIEALKVRIDILEGEKS